MYFLFSTLCPLYSILLAVGRTEIDFFELDVEGSEYKILKTIPWHKVDIKVILTIFLLHLHLHFVITATHLQKSEFGFPKGGKNIF